MNLVHPRCYSGGACGPSGVPVRSCTLGWLFRPKRGFYLVAGRLQPLVSPSAGGTMAPLPVRPGSRAGLSRFNIWGRINAGRASVLHKSQMEVRYEVASCFPAGIGGACRPDAGQYSCFRLSSPAMAVTAGTPTSASPRRASLSTGIRMTGISTSIGMPTVTSMTIRPAAAIGAAACGLRCNPCASPKLGALAARNDTPGHFVSRGQRVTL